MSKKKRTITSKPPATEETSSQQRVLALTLTFNPSERERIDEALVARFGEHISNLTPESLDGVEAAITQAPLIGVVVLGERLENSRVGSSGRTYPQEIRNCFQNARKKVPPIFVRDRVTGNLRQC